MKKIILTLCLLVSTLLLNAQPISRIMAGFGGGLTSNFIEGPSKTRVGGNANLVLGYVMTTLVNNEAELGLRTGLGLTYSTLRLRSEFSASFSNIDYYGHQMDYTITSGTVYYNHSQYVLDIPVMFAIKAKGIYVNFGPKLLFPLYGSYTQNMDDLAISAYYPDFGITVRDEVAIGYLGESVSSQGKVDLPKFMLAFSAELGHVWSISRGSSLGLDIFVDYTLLSVGSTADRSMPIISVAPIVEDSEAPKAAVTMNPLTNCNDFNFKYLNAGVRLVYTFDLNGN